MFISRVTPRPIGHTIAAAVALVIIVFKPEVYWIVYSNLRHVLGPEADEQTLHQTTRRVFHNNTRNVYELWHITSQGIDAIRDAFQFPPELWESVDRVRDLGKGCIIVGTHTGNFDLALMTMGAQGLDAQALGLAIPPGGGFTLMDEMRREAGVYLTPIGVHGLREAIQRLRNGGFVMTGVDRPVRGSQLSIEFFGQMSYLPTGHVRLAMKADACIIVASPYVDENGQYTAQISPPLEIERTGDLEQDVQHNLRRVTRWLERFISDYPEQWSMFVRVWPD